MATLRRFVIALAGAAVVVVPRVEAAQVNVGAPALVAPGWARIAGRYEGGGKAPVFRAVARCGADQVQVLDGVVHLAPATSALWIDLPGTPDHLVPERMPCETPEVSVEMLVDEAVVASTPVAAAEVVAGSPAGLLAAPPAPAPAGRRFRLKGEKFGAPLTGRTEAGVEWALDSRVSIQLNYERTAQAPMMPFDHDNGILTRLRIGF